MYVGPIRFLKPYRSLFIIVKVEIAQKQTEKFMK